MFRFLNMRSEAVGHLKRGNLSGYVRKHVNAAFAGSIHGNPSERRKLVLHHLDATRVHAIRFESFDDDPPIIIVADQPEPTGFRSEPRHLRQIIRSHSARMNLESLGVDFSSAPNSRGTIAK